MREIPGMVIINPSDDVDVISGLGSAVAELLGEKCPAPITRIGMKDQFGESGTAKELLHKYGLDAEGIYKAVSVGRNGSALSLMQ